MAFVERLAATGVGPLESLCEECQTAAWLGVMDLPGVDTSCVLRLPPAFPPAVRELEAALLDGDEDAMVDCLVTALAAVDTAVVRAELAAAVLVLERDGRCRPEVAAAALADLASPAASLLVLATLLRAVAGAGATPATSGLVGAVG